MAEYILGPIQTSTAMHPSEDHRFDYLVRLTGNQNSGSLYVASWHTEDIAKTFYLAIEENKYQIDTLLGVINWQHELLDYNGHYNAFLLEQTTEKEFEDIAQRFSYEPKEVLPDFLVQRIRTILDLTNINYTPSDFASLFRCNRESVLDAIDRLSNQEQQRVSGE